MAIGACAPRSTSVERVCSGYRLSLGRALPLERGLHPPGPFALGQIVAVNELPIERGGRRRLPQRCLDLGALEERDRRDGLVHRCQESVLRVPVDPLLPGEESGGLCRVACGQQP
jgi:hypothetical protein